jgi:hypothetical protein
MFYILIVFSVLLIILPTLRKLREWAASARLERPNLLYGKPTAMFGTETPSNVGAISADYAYLGEPPFTAANLTSLSINAIVLALLVRYLTPNSSTWASLIVGWSQTYPILSALSATVLLIIATAIGAFRLVNIKLMRNASAHPTKREDGLQFLLFLGDVPSFGWQYSGLVRSVTWSLVAISAMIASLLISSPLSHFLGFSSALTFWLILGLRLLLSSLPAKFLL